MAARTPTRLFAFGTSPLKTSLYAVQNVTTSDTVDVGSTGTNDYTKTFLILSVAYLSGTYAVTTLTNATNFTISTASLTGEDCLVLVIGAST